MLRAGARAYLLKEDDFDELVTAVERVMNGQFYLSSSIRGMSVGDFLTGGGAGLIGSFARLTRREREILHWLASGESIRDLATRLNVSPKTLYTHREHIMTKLGVHTSAELLKVALQSRALYPDSLDTSE